MSEDRFRREASTFLCRSKKNNVSAEAFIEGDNTFLVRKGSTAKGDPKRPPAGRLHKLLAEGVVVEVPGHRYEFLKNCQFNSPSAAASFVLGRSGKPDDWKKEPKVIA
jgi:hypothetical protein